MHQFILLILLSDVIRLPNCLGFKQRCPIVAMCDCSLGILRTVNSTDGYYQVSEILIQDPSDVTYLIKIFLIHLKGRNSLTRWSMCFRHIYV